MSYVRKFEQIDRTHVAVVGGKGASLGELSRIEGVRVPDGFCVTTFAYRQILALATSIDDQLDVLSCVEPDDREAIGELSARIRRTIEAVAVPEDLTAEIEDSLATRDPQTAWAVRSSATAEDLPTASFAGQQDSYLNVVGSAAVLRHVQRCWASLFTERAVIYRARNRFDHRKVLMAVVVQQMVPADAAGVLFTADPVTSNRKIATVEAVWGLGEALVSGLVNADAYSVRDDEVISTSVAAKQLVRQAAPRGGTQDAAVTLEQQTRPALTDAQVLRLVRLGRQIEAHFGRPQDIEWCLVLDEFHVVQSRPITTLFPVPESDDADNHAYLSVGHQQMMTDAMKPLGLSFWQMTTPAPMAEAGGRLFVDVTSRLASSAGRDALLELARKSDPLTSDALQTVLDRAGFIRPLADDGAGTTRANLSAAPIETDAVIVTDLIENTEASVSAMRHKIQTLSGLELLDFIAADLVELKGILFDPRSFQVLMAGFDATWWLDEHLETWLGEKGAGSALSQSVPGNITSEMGLALLDVADAIRPYVEVVAFLQRIATEGSHSDDFIDQLPNLPGGVEARDAVRAYLAKYGMRCAGEIDITRPRWSEQPAMLVPTILSHIENFEPGAGSLRFEQGRQQAARKEQEVLTRLRALPDGQRKSDETKETIDRVRTFAGYREYPKYGKVCRYFAYKQALLGEAERLIRAGIIQAKEDIFYLRFDELREVVRTGRVDVELIQSRRAAFREYESLRPPRVLTSEGEAINGKHRRNDLPRGALPGLPVSAGTIQGRARVVLDMTRAELVAGGILVTTYTDPSWTGPMHWSLRRAWSPRSAASCRRTGSSPENVSDDDVREPRNHRWTGDRISMQKDRHLVFRRDERRDHRPGYSVRSPRRSRIHR